MKVRYEAFWRDGTVTVGEVFDCSVAVMAMMAVANAQDDENLDFSEGGCRRIRMIREGLVVWDFDYRQNKFLVCDLDWIRLRDGAREPHPLEEA